MLDTHNFPRGTSHAFIVPVSHILSILSKLLTFIIRKTRGKSFRERERKVSLVFGTSFLYVLWLPTAKTPFRVSTATKYVHRTQPPPPAAAVGLTDEGQKEKYFSWERSVGGEGDPDGIICP